MVEASCVVRVDFSRGPKVLTAAEEVGHFFDILAEEVFLRNPGAKKG